MKLITVLIRHITILGCQFRMFVIRLRRMNGFRLDVTDIPTDELVLSLNYSESVHADGFGILYRIGTATAVISIKGD